MCICDFPRDCAGLGMLLCEGCGGDMCVCPCGGDMDCPGCEACATDLDLDDFCECLKCGFVGLVRAGGEVCPGCNGYGALVDRDPTTFEPASA